jgi:hypothetical protein
MDDNKKNVLCMIDYVVRRCCGTCDNAMLPRGVLFGHCKVHQYDHKKHRDNPHYMSVCTWGYCGHYTPSDEKLEVLHGFDEFLEEPPQPEDRLQFHDCAICGETDANRALRYCAETDEYKCTDCIASGMTREDVAHIRSRRR